MSGMDLVAFLKARLDETETEARSLLAGAQRTSLVLQDPRYLGKRVPGWYHWPEVESMATHVLAEVEAKRSILRDLEQAELTLSAAGTGTPPHDLMTGAVNMMRRTVHLLALPYAGHADYREEWRA